MARLKVFAAKMGFFETVVAAPSRKAALAAWGTKQNLFGEGMAAPADNPAAIEAALAHPGVVLRRPMGSKAQFREGAPAAAARSPPKVHPARVKPPPDRSRLTAAEKALAASKARFATERAGLQRRLDRLAGAEQKETARLAKAVARAAAVWRAAGGEE